MLKQYIDLYDNNDKTIDAGSAPVLNERRKQARVRLEGAHLSVRGDEGFPVISVADMFAPDFGVNTNRIPFGLEPSEAFHCGVPNVSTLLALVSNDIFVATPSLLRNLPQGVTVTSLAAAAKQDPKLVAAYYDSLAAVWGDSATALNTMLVQDGVFVHVAAGVQLDRPIQIVNVFNTPFPLLAPRRILVVMETGAKASILVCDHSVNREIQYLSSQVVELFVDRDAHLEYYDLEESSPLTSRMCQVFVQQHEGSHVVTNATTLIAGTTVNSYCVDQQGQHTETLLAGMAIGRDKMLVHNHTRVLHNCPKGHSQQLFKYILDDVAKGEFYGTIRVDEAAKFTEAYQSNRNILVQGDARMYTRPQLEIYCDEVKCSHGATVGQLDAAALFYMRQRGIPEAEAKMMLMQAFVADVVDTVEIPALRSRLHQLVEARLQGQNCQCADCSVPTQQ